MDEQDFCKSEAPFPAWPFSLTKFYACLSLDSADYLTAMTRIASEAWSADSRYGLRFCQDYAKGVEELLLAPWAAAAAAAEPEPGRQPTGGGGSSSAAGSGVSGTG